MSADGNLKFGSNSHPPAIGHKKRAERTCALCELPLRGQPPVLLKSGESVHVGCYFRMKKRPRNSRTN
jgi:hypothetical protein